MIFISFISYNLSMVTQPLNNAKTKPRQPLSSAFLFIMTALLIRPHAMQKVKVKALESLLWPLRRQANANSRARDLQLTVAF